MLTSQAQFRVVGYLPTWNGYPTSITNVDLTKLTHLNIAFANPDANGDIIMSGGTLTDLSTVINAAHAENVEVLLSIGGAGAPGTTYQSLISSNQTTFINKIVQFTIDNNLDGIDVDIEGDVLNGTTLTSTQYEGFIVALEVALHAQSKLMTAALATWFANRVTNLAASKFDFINIMSYDAYGTWTGPGQHSPYTLAVDDLTYWQTTKAMPANKLVVGVPFYGYYWRGSATSSQTYSNITTNNIGAENKDKVIASNGAIIYYNGIPTIKQKTVLALTQASGIMIWELTGDAVGSKSLLSAIHEVIQGYATNVAPTISILNPNNLATFAEGDAVQIDVDATDIDGTIMKVEYFAGTYKIGESYGSTNTIDWTGAAAGTYSLTAIATDNMGVSTVSAAISITFSSVSSSPFSGTAIDIPGTIEIENFNLGGNNVGYNDLTTSNLGGAYRTGRVDIEECVDIGGGYNVGWIDGGEWLDYTVNVITSGNYIFNIRTASQVNNKSMTIEFDGVDAIGSIGMPNTGGWQKWVTHTSSNIALTAGIKKMRLKFTTGGYNLNYIEVITNPVSNINDFNNTTNINSIYPNPYNENSTLEFNLKKAGLTKISIIDAVGKEQKILHHDFMDAGKQMFLLKDLALPKGTYHCIIQSAEERLTLKFMSF